jgi:hypothetical protein
MTQQEQTQRAFIHFSRSWYAPYNNHRDGMIDCVTFGDWNQDGSGNGANVVWYSQGPRLEVFNDAWFMLAGMSDLLSTLGNLDSTEITPLDFCDILDAMGFQDWTQATKDGPRAYLQQRPAAPEAAGHTIADRLYYYAPWGDMLAGVMGEGWYVGEVTEVYVEATRVAFVLTDGEVIERNLIARRLLNAPANDAPVQNAACRTWGSMCYLHTTDYGWLRVKVARIESGLATVVASWTPSEVYEDTVPLCDLVDALPAGVIALNVPLVAERADFVQEIAEGAPVVLVAGLSCPNCEQINVDSGAAQQMCGECHFVYLRPEGQEEQTHAM